MSEKAETNEEAAPIQAQSAQELAAIAELGPNPTIEQILALHRLDG